MILHAKKTDHAWESADSLSQTHCARSHAVKQTRPQTLRPAVQRLREEIRPSSHRDLLYIPKNTHSSVRSETPERYDDSLRRRAGAREREKERGRSALRPDILSQRKHGKPFCVWSSKAEHTSSRTDGGGFSRTTEQTHKPKHAWRRSNRISRADDPELAKHQLTSSHSQNTHAFTQNRLSFFSPSVWASVYHGYVCAIKPVPEKIKCQSDRQWIESSVNIDS